MQADATENTETTRIRVMIVDDHEMVRRGLTVALQSFADLELAGEARNGEAALELCRRACPHVVLMDLHMPGMGGVAAIAQLRVICPAARVVALTSYFDEDTVQQALQAGALSYLIKTITIDELAAAIRRAHSGQSTLSPEAAQVLITATQRPPEPGHDLTVREREVLALMIEGLNNREIGARLYISSSTVKNHVSSILTKLGAHTRTLAVAVAVERKLV